jgi:hypothetical protein
MHPSHRYSRAAALAAVAALITLILPGLPTFGQSPELQKKLAAVKQSAAANKQRLMHYQWIETQQATLKGEAKPAQQFLCQYGPDGQVQKTPVLGGTSAQDQQQRNGKLKQRMIDKKKAEIQDYLGEVKGVLAMYLPPDPQKMQEDFQAGKASATPSGDLIFKDYAQPGDQMVLTFNLAKKKMEHVGVDTYVQQPSQAVNLMAQFATLPDGTNYVRQTVLNVKAKEMVITTTNSGYQKLGH